MLKKVYRLNKISLNKPRSIQASFFTLKTVRNSLALNRFAFVVSKKIDKRATVRNSIKRKLRSCIEEIFDKIETGNDFVFYPKNKIIAGERREILKELESVFSAHDLLKQ